MVRHHLVAHLVVGQVAPPEEDVGLGEHPFAQAVLGLVEGSGAHRQTGQGT